MKSYKDPSFQDRVARATEAKKKALAALKSKPPVDPQIVAERQAARLRRETAAAEKRDARKAAEQSAKAVKAEALAADTPASLGAAELKAARDARYAARKNRK